MLTFGLVASAAAARLMRHVSPATFVEDDAPETTFEGAHKIVIPAAAPPVTTEPPPTTSGPSYRRPGRSAGVAEGQAGELALMREAQAAYASDDFQAALRLLAEHARRYASGRLVEEREALRVRALLHCGRSDEARRAFNAFAGRFSESMLLPSLRRTIDGEP
jgi:hypothetical protein